MPQVKVLPPCPRCDSVCTGMIRYDSYVNEQKVMYKSAKKGYHTVIRLPERGRVTDLLPNHICLECGCEWLDEGGNKYEYLEGEEYEDYLAERNIILDVKREKPSLTSRIVNKIIQKFKKKGD